MVVAFFFFFFFFFKPQSNHTVYLIPIEMFAPNIFIEFAFQPF